MEEIKDKMKSIALKQSQAITLRQQLERSLAIQELWPGVFSADAIVAAVWSGEKHGIYFTIKRTVPLPSNMKTEARVFALKDVPAALHDTLPAQLMLRLHESQRKQAVMRKLRGGEPT